jgi:capsule biosynthesis phosphatase
MKICIDIDGTICHLRSGEQSYADVHPLPGAVETIRGLKAAGHRIILLTARHMSTCGSNVGLVIARQGKTLIDWLAQHGIPYDELWFGKPHADVYIDDNAFRFTDWASIDPHGHNLPVSAEKTAKASLKALQIVVPMAGAGSRFAEAGYKLPKPLIPVMDKPMYAWAVDSLPLDRAKSLHFVLLETAPCKQRLADDIQRRYSSYNTFIHFVPHLTRGQTETVLAVTDQLALDAPLIIHNADTAFISLSSTWDFLDDRTVDGALIVFHSEEDRWSYSKADTNGRVIEVREKAPISTHASTGTYYFRTAELFLQSAHTQVESSVYEMQEFYIGPLYNTLVASGHYITNTHCDRVLCFGTPEDLYTSLQHLLLSAE